MTANRILILSLILGVLLVLCLFGPYINIGIYPLMGCCALNFAALIVLRKVDISESAPVSMSLKAFVKFFYVAIASTIVPFIIFLYLAAETWVKLIAALSILLCGIACSRIIGLVERRERAR